jgi:hypothetical protein
VNRHDMDGTAGSMKGQNLLDLFSKAHRAHDSGDLVGAIMALEELVHLQFDFDHGYPHFWLASMYQEINEFKSAQQSCKNGFRFPRHQDWNQLILYAKASAACGNLARVTRLIKRAMESEANIGASFFDHEYRIFDLLDIAHCWRQHNRPENLFTALIADMPSHTQIWARLQEMSDNDSNHSYIRHSSQDINCPSVGAE